MAKLTVINSEVTGIHYSIDRSTQSNALSHPYLTYNLTLADGGTFTHLHTLLCTCMSLTPTSCYTPGSKEAHALTRVKENY